MTTQNIIATDSQLGMALARKVPDLDGLYRTAKALALSNSLPVGLMGNKEGKFPVETIAGNVLRVVMHGQEVGLSPAMSLQSICIIHGNTALFGTALMAVLRKSPEFNGKAWKESWDEKKQAYTCSMTRGREKPLFETREVTFSLDKAKKMGFAAKNPKYTSDPETMLMWKARHYVARELFPDVLAGMGVAENLVDEPYEVIEGETIDTSEPPQEKVGAVVETEIHDPPEEPPEPMEKPLEDHTSEELWGKEDWAQQTLDQETEFLVLLEEDPYRQPDFKAWYNAMKLRIGNAMSVSEVEALQSTNAEAWLGFKKAFPKIAKELTSGTEKKITFLRKNGKL